MILCGNFLIDTEFCGSCRKQMVCEVKKDKKESWYAMPGKGFAYQLITITVICFNRLLAILIQKGWDGRECNV